MRDTPDVAIVGAGAAGIAAARHISDLGRSVLLVEALPRLGGRALTAQVAGLPLDLGCGWLHSAERNPLIALATAAGVEVDRSKAAWGEELREVGATAGTLERAWDAYEEFGNRLRRDPPASDRAGDAMSPGDPCRPFVDALSGFMNGAGIDQFLVAGATAGVLGVAAVATAFAGMVSDPVQRALGLHHRRLNRFIDSLEAAFHHSGAAGSRHTTLYVARLIDLLDLLVGVTRTLRTA